MATREQLLAWGIRKTDTVDIGDGLTFKVRQLNAEEITESHNKAKESGASNENIAMTAFVIARSAINEDGSRIFSDEDGHMILKEFSYQKLGELVEPIFTLNGILKKQAEQTEKN